MGWIWIKFVDGRSNLSLDKYVKTENKKKKTLGIPEQPFFHF